MALGIPTIATAIGANFRVIDNNKSGFLIPVNDLDGWFNTILALTKNIELRERIGKSGRKRVVELYSTKANKDQYLSVISGIN